MRFALAVIVRYVLFTIFTLALLPCVISQGLTFDSCQSSQGCASTRTCNDGRCIPPRPISCISDAVCPEGEACYVIPLTTGRSPAICASVQGVRGTGAEPVTQPNPRGGGLTGELCSRNEDCRSPRACVQIEPGNRAELCVGSSDCLCAPPVFQECEADGDCPDGETCGTAIGPICAVAGTSSDPVIPVPKPTAIVDPEFVEESIENGRGPSSSSSETVVITREVCVAERHLKGVKGVYESGRLAHVLCDSRGSCATPGHLVVFHGRGMMMRSYCDVVGCAKSVMKVNSPRWERQLRVKSWSDGLEFTAFAARYETAAEEIVLAGAVRAGL